MSKAKTGDIVFWSVVYFDNGRWWTSATFDCREHARAFARKTGRFTRIAKVVISK